MQPRIRGPRRRVGAGRPGPSYGRLQRILDTASGERDLHRHLEEHPWIIWKLFEHGPTVNFIISHFSLGDEYEGDFVMLSGFSGGWYVHFIEIEPPAISPFNAAGNFSARMNHAAGQLRSWHLFSERADKRGYLISQLARAAKEKDVLWADGREPLCSAGLRFDDVRAGHLFEFHIIMGRRSQLDRDEMERKAALPKTDGFDLITCDRLLEVAHEIHSNRIYEDP